jgi:hypothetical protein
MAVGKIEKPECPESSGTFPSASAKLKAAIDVSGSPAVCGSGEGVSRVLGRPSKLGAQETGRKGGARRGAAPSAMGLFRCQGGPVAATWILGTGEAFCRGVLRRFRIVWSDEAR